MPLESDFADFETTFANFETHLTEIKTPINDNSTFPLSLLFIVRGHPLYNPEEKGKGRYLMVADASFLCHFGAVLTDELLCLDSMTLEKLAHGIKVLHWYDIVFRIVEEHHVEVTAGCPAASKRILAEGALESARQGAIGIKDGRCADVTRLFSLD